MNPQAAGATQAAIDAATKKEQIPKQTTALHDACRNGNAAEVKKLLEQEGVDINAKAAGGVTPLMTAITNDKTPVVLLLLQKGADPTITDEEGKTAFAYTDRPDFIDWLEANQRLSGRKAIIAGGEKPFAARASERSFATPPL